MNRVYLLYLLLLLFTVTVMSFVTQKLRKQERLEQVQSLAAENERLALWRLESKLLPLVIRESSRVYEDVLFAAGNHSELPTELIGCFRLSSLTDHTQFDWKAVPTAEPEKEIVDRDWQNQVQEDCEQAVMLAAINAGPDNKLVADELGQPSLSPITTPTENYASNALQQSARSEQEYRSRSSNQSFNAELVNQLQMQAFPIAQSVRIEPLNAVWVDQRLYFVRKGSQQASGSIEGCLVNWTWLKPQLLAAVSDLLPQADLVPLASVSDNAHSLASLPLRLIPGEPDLTNLPITSALWPTLVIAWVCFLISAIALGLLLIGVVRLSERRAAFVSAVTHELRTPLTTLRLYADLLSQPQPLPSDKFQRYVQTLRRESNRLHYLIENVLGWSRLEQSAATLVEPVRWHDLLQRLEPSLQDRTAQADCVLVEESTELCQAATFLGNATAVERILFNLIDNACKYSRASVDQRIHLRSQVTDRWLHITVQDHGKGIDAAMRHRLFKPFSKSAEEAAKSAPGIGLGLSLSRRLARDMHGDLRLIQSDQAGTTFELRVPLT